MVRIPNTEQFQRLSHSHVNKRQPQADEDDFGVLDDSILDSDAADMSPSSQNRKESFAESARVFSSSGSPWSSYRYGPEQVALQSSDQAVQSLIEHGNDNVFPGQSAPQGISYPNQTPAWHLSGTSGSCTPTADYENISSDYANSMMMMPSYSHGTTNSSTAATTTFDGPHVQTAPLYLANLASSTSPQSGKDWASISSSEQLGDWSTSAQPHPNSPFHPGSLQNFRRDGIRKKNARFEIPAERNLRTIDHLINQTNDEQEIKELKQQKRLLRNRQAAYATLSRVIRVYFLTDVSQTRFPAAEETTYGTFRGGEKALYHHHYRIGGGSWRDEAPGNRMGPREREQDCLGTAVQTVYRHAHHGKRRIGSLSYNRIRGVT